jgi:hypothetical protein
MAMVCPQCSDSFQQRLDCPHCGVRLHYQPGPSPRHNAHPESSWQQTPWGRLFVGLLLAQGLYYVLRHLCTAGLLVASEEATNVWATLTGLIVVQAMQAVSVLGAGLLTGAGQRQGLLYGALVGMWNSAFFLILQRWTGQPLTAVNLFGEPILHVAFGAAGGLIGRLVWRPLPSLPGAIRVQPVVARTVQRGGPSRLSGPIAWTRVCAGVAIAVAGVMFADVIRDFVIEASEGRLRIDTRLQADLVTCEIEVLSILVGGAFAGATTLNCFKQGLAVGIGSGALIFAFRVLHAQPQSSLAILLGTLASALTLGMVGGWFGAQLLPPVCATPRRKHFGPASAVG